MFNISEPVNSTVGRRGVMKNRESVVFGDSNLEGDKTLRKREDGGFLKSSHQQGV